MAERPDAAVTVVPEPDVVRALHDLGFEPSSFTPIGGYPRWRQGRVTYRVELTSGDVVKVRRLTRTLAPKRAARLVAALDDPDLPAPLFLEGRVTVERWIDGDSLATIGARSRDVDGAADLLARLHARTLVPGHAFRRVGSLVPLYEKTCARIDALQDVGLLTRGEQRRLVKELRGGLPARATRGVVHGDLCAHNLVVTADGRVVSIDNERVRIDFLDLDLARTWLRWPMSTREHARFERRYASWGRPVPEGSEAASWRVCAAVKSAITLRGTPSVGRDLARAQLDRLFE